MISALPARAQNWTPKDRSRDFAIAFSGITRHKPAGGIAQVWK
jgi:hypothetical protein